ncbi:hypothetical protein QOZ80_5BG0416940 [Eleusine coracana subsp. coracana]|nr:hypothetical protein QOZ80_5BG0416940 [Eleusine coracana subsp. coracana]
MALAASNAPAALMASELMERGRKSAAALEALLQTASTTASNPAQHDIRELAEKIICCLDRALAALHGEGADNDDATSGCPSGKRRSPPDAGAQARPKRSRRSRVIGAEMPTRVEKRSTPDDGLLWRKYGQKDILNSKYPRTYFRCTYKHDNGCKATRQVQQSEDDPSVYVVTYFGEHTCGMHAAATPTVGEHGKSPQLVINFGAGTSNGSPWLSATGNDDAGSNSSQQVPPAACSTEEEQREQKEMSVCQVESILASQPAEPISSADDSCASPDLDALVHCFDWDSCVDSLFDMELINFDEASLLQ